MANFSSKNDNRKSDFDMKEAEQAFKKILEEENQRREEILAKQKEEEEKQRQEESERKALFVIQEENEQDEESHANEPQLLLRPETVAKTVVKESKKIDYSEEMDKKLKQIHERQERMMKTELAD